MGHTILVAEDEEAIRQVLTEMLGIVDDGYEVDVAVDGQEALDKIRAKSYSILLSDIMMPRMNGMQLLEVLAREFPELPVIIITGVREEKNVLGCLASGAWDYILKPFDVAQVRAAVRRALAISKNRRGGPTGLKVVSSGPGWLELTASSEVEYLRRFRKFTEVLLGARLTASDREDIRLAIEELGRNAIEWGNRSQEGKKVHLSYGLFDDRVVFKIEDEGEGFIPKEVPDPSVNPIAHVERRRNDGKRPGGYGIHIVRKLVDELEYNEKGNGVCLTKYLM
jgi:DNA-binding response OmpR family regulator